MKRKAWILSAILCVGAAALGRSATGETPAATLNDVFATGETLDYDLSWLSIPGGTARMTIGVNPEDPSHFHITSLAKSSPAFAVIANVRDQIDSIVDRSDFSTVRYDKRLDEKGKVKEDTTLVDQQRGIATRVRPQKTNEQVPVPRPVFDPLSLVYHLRELDLQPGKTQTFTVYGDGQVYTLNANVTGRETLRTPAGTFSTVVVQPNMRAGGLFRDEGSLTIWYSDDARHIPVQIRSDIKVGSIVATLKNIQQGVADGGASPAAGSK